MNIKLHHYYNKLQSFTLVGTTLEQQNEHANQIVNLKNDADKYIKSTVDFVKEIDKKQPSFAKVYKK